MGFRQGDTSGVRHLFCPLKARRDYGSATSQLGQKYAEIATFELFYPHFIFCVDEHGYREKVTKQFRTVRIVIELDCGNT